MLTVETMLDPVEINGIAIKGLPRAEDQMTVSNHRIDNALVVLNWHNCNVTLSASDLERAIRTAQNR